MISSHRTIISFCLSVLYLLIVLTPLAPLALHSPRLAHAITGECSGDCSICGCSPERSAARACCCWQNRRAADQRQLAALRGDTADEPDEQRKVSSCCMKKRSVATTQCDDGEGHDKSRVISHASRQPGESGQAVTSISACPCGSAREIFHPGFDTGQHLPSRFTGGIPRVSLAIPSHTLAEPLVSRHTEPPVPPPKIPHLS